MCEAVGNWQAAERGASTKAMRGLRSINSTLLALANLNYEQPLFYLAG